MISAADLAAMRATAEASFDTSVTIQRNTPTADIWGSQTDVWATVATCQARIATPQTPTLAQLAAQVGAMVIYRISVPASVDVRVEDRIVVGADQFRVHAVESQQSYTTANQALCAEVR